MRFNPDLKAWGEDYAARKSISLTALVSRLLSDFRDKVEREEAATDAEQA